MAVRLRLLCLFTAMLAMVPLLSACGSSHGSGYDYRHRHVVTSSTTSSATATTETDGN